MALLFISSCSLKYDSTRSLALGTIRSPAPGNSPDFSYGKCVLYSLPSRCHVICLRRVNFLTSYAVNFRFFSW